MFFVPFALGGTAALIFGIILIICILWSIGIIPFLIMTTILGIIATLIGGTIGAYFPPLLYAIVGFFAGGLVLACIDYYIPIDRIESSLALVTLAEIFLFVAEIAIELVKYTMYNDFSSTFLVYIMGFLAIVWILLVIHKIFQQVASWLS